MGANLRERETLLSGIGHANYTAANPCPCIPDRLSTVVDLRMNNYAATDNRILRARDANVGNCDFKVRFAFSVCLKVA